MISFLFFRSLPSSLLKPDFPIMVSIQSNSSFNGDTSLTIQFLCHSPSSKFQKGTLQLFVQAVDCLYCSHQRVESISVCEEALSGVVFQFASFSLKLILCLLLQQELANALPRTCTSKLNPNLCLFPEYFAGDIQTPLFGLESAFDSFQVHEI
ncbi:hypothetical protein SASPL_102518 [Salvia splendens]|uniref:Pectin acetylesterase n=1 Tax=Salvia splendens TaxID=180675 RepID=A0A8X8YSR4_SALSN|nr:hypothetical protein SASPL_102518 [Salvia splendens]